MQVVVAEQVKVGVDVINNGDINAGMTLLDFGRVFEGLEQRPTEGFELYEGVPDEDMETYSGP